MTDRSEIIKCLLTQAWNIEAIDTGDRDKSDRDAKMLREAAQLLNMDADLRDQYEVAIQANAKLLKTNKPHLITEADFDNADIAGFIPAWIEYMPGIDAFPIWKVVNKSVLDAVLFRGWSSRPTKEQMETTPWQ